MRRTERSLDLDAIGEISWPKKALRDRSRWHVLSGHIGSVKFVAQRQELAKPGGALPPLFPSVGRSHLALCKGFKGCSRADPMTDLSTPLLGPL